MVEIDYWSFSKEMRDCLDMLRDICEELYPLTERIQRLMDKEYNGDKERFIERIRYCMDFYSLRDYLNSVLR